MTDLRPIQTPTHAGTKFSLLLSGGLAAFLFWALLFSYCSKLWTPSASDRRGFTVKSRYGYASNGSFLNDDSLLLYIDIWFALALMAALDAFAVVLDFNRSLIHQFHYFVSLRMMSLSFIISGAAFLLRNGKSETLVERTAAVCLMSCLVYLILILIQQRLHKLLPPRGIGISSGSFEQFSNHICSFDVPWQRAIILATINGLVGLALTTLVPTRWTFINPVIHITFEVTLLGLADTKQTPRYIWFATPIVQASTFTDWGLRQLIAAPKLLLPPWMFLAVMLGGRLLLDLHLWTIFRHRYDFQRARNSVLFSTKKLTLVFAMMLLAETAGLPVVVFIKPISVAFLHIAGVLVFLLPACYGLSFNKIKTIRS